MARTVDPNRVAERREAIVRAAGVLFAEHGYEGTTAAQIARAAGLSSASVFYYFADKAAVFRAIFESSIPEHAEMLARHRDREDCAAAIVDIAETLAAEVLDPSAPGLMVELLRRMDHDPALTEIVLEDARRSAEVIAELLRRGMADGQFEPGFAPERFARWILAIVDAAFLNCDPADPQDPRPLVRATICRLLCPLGMEAR
ncbi:TetR/AcrR family transcriptional regulator [Nocardia panacis]|uniref:TetR/AcrR family transcriptional regulator n=1 Tax=Nocardia panacis TaxID=2340916 RepID=A0A3A4K5X9_9NOCA|nr:TetR/AcrR family transcriptional regulator [Nocardia panacis]RJO68330.1 TetR/AcrR family transcriptional regulator [Nocardia panacis]